jgi:hypothetical protein
MTTEFPDETGDAGDPPPKTPRFKFLTALERWFRVWLICILAALGVTIFGIFPTVISIVALMGAIWVPIVVLALWGRMLDETMRPHSDLEDHPR